eukprot:6210125-Pleurochrysis_carterae.AAC.5
MHSSTLVPSKASISQHVPLIEEVNLKQQWSMHARRRMQYMPVIVCAYECRRAPTRERDRGVRSPAAASYRMTKCSPACERATLHVRIQMTTGAPVSKCADACLQWERACGSALCLRLHRSCHSRAPDMQ